MPQLVDARLAALGQVDERGLVLAALRLRPKVDTARHVRRQGIDAGLAARGLEESAQRVAEINQLLLKCLVGFLQRPERVLFLGFGAIIGKIGLIVAIYVVAVLSVFTALQRMFHIYVSSRKTTPED